jgi:hypothetical protein
MPLTGTCSHRSKYFDEASAMSDEEQFLGQQRAPRCYSRAVCQASTSLPRDCQTSAALLVLSIATCIVAFAASYGGWFY